MSWALGEQSAKQHANWEDRKKKTVIKLGEFEYGLIYYDPSISRHGFNERETWVLYFSRLLTNGSQPS